MESATKIYFADICPKCSNKESDSQQAVVTCVMFVFLIAHQLTLQWDLPSAKPGFRSVYPRRDSVSWDGRAAQCPRNTRLPPPRCRLSLLTVSIRSLGDEEMPQLKSECQTEEHWGKHKVKKIRQKNGEHVEFLQVETEFGTFSFYPTVRSGSFFDAKNYFNTFDFPWWAVAVFPSCWAWTAEWKQQLLWVSFQSNVNEAEKRVQGICVGGNVDCKKSCP